MLCLPFLSYYLICSANSRRSMASEMLSVALLLLLLLFYYMLYGSNASCLRAWPDLLTKNRFNLPPLPQLGKLMRVT